jgi:flavin-dependent dehydrogenase
MSKHEIENGPETSSQVSQISQMKADVIIVGSSISGLMTSCYLKLKLPHLNILVIGPRPEQEKRAYIGESLTEISIHFFWEIGLKDYLDRTHDRKNGLTFYHKLRIDDPKDYRYSVHAPGESLYYHSRQLNRPIFDRDLYQHAVQMGVQFLDGKVKEVNIGEGQHRHQVIVKTKTGECVQLSARWIVDATGQNRIVGKKVTTYTRPETGQRSAFWLRLADFNNFLPQLELSMRRPHDYDLWHSTHHFMGHANWIWCIPLQSSDYKNLVSVGITYRPDLYHHPLQTLEHFLAAVESEHPAVAAMVRSGQVLDTQSYRNYLYSADRVYSADGWFLVGNAARTVDPLYSTGLAMTALQIQQITEIVRRDLANTLETDDVEVLSSLWYQITARRQVDITDQYATMHDPFAAHLRRYWNLNGWWNAILPLWWCGFLTHPQGAHGLIDLLQGGEKSERAAWDLFRDASKQIGAIEPRDFEQTFDFDQIINRRFDRSIESIPQQLSRYFLWRLKIRFHLMKRLGWQQQLHQAQPLLQELTRMLAVKYLFRLKFRSLFQTINPPLSCDHTGAAKQDHTA